MLRLVYGIILCVVPATLDLHTRAAWTSSGKLRAPKKNMYIKWSPRAHACASASSSAAAAARCRERSPTCVRNATLSHRRHRRSRWLHEQKKKEQQKNSTCECISQKDKQPLFRMCLLYVCNCPRVEYCLFRYGIFSLVFRFPSLCCGRARAQLDMLHVRAQTVSLFCGTAPRLSTLGSAARPRGDFSRPQRE